MPVTDVAHAREVAGWRREATAGVLYRLEVDRADGLGSFGDDRLLESGLICRADDRVDPVVQLSPVLTCGPDEFAEIESILRSVLTEAQKEWLG